MRKHKRFRLSDAPLPKECPPCPPCEDRSGPPDISAGTGMFRAKDTDEQSASEYVLLDYGYRRESKEKKCGKGAEGYVELTMVDVRDAETLKVRPGPAMRMCTTSKAGAAGVLIPVSTPRKAAEMVREFKKCLGTESASSCAAKANETIQPGVPQTLGRVHVKRRRAFR